MATLSGSRLLNEINKTEKCVYISADDQASHSCNPTGPACNESGNARELEVDFLKVVGPVGLDRGRPGLRPMDYEEFARAINY